MDQNLTCPGCRATSPPTYFYCPFCGRKLREKPLSTSVTAQIVLYLESSLLPPFGLFPAVKYLKQADEKSKIIGWVAVMLTAISLMLTIYITFGFFDQMSKMYGSQSVLNLGY